MNQNQSQKGNLTKCKHKFTESEDQMIIEQVRKNGAKNWEKISEFIPGRTGRQCRERWINYLCPDVSHSMWTQDEDLLLRNLFQQFGKQWSRIASYFPTRTDVMLKNRWALLNRQISKLKKSKEKKTKTKQQNFQSGSEVQQIPQTDGLRLVTPIVIPVINLDIVRIQNCKNDLKCEAFSHFIE